jgi:hypothetical protein
MTEETPQVKFRLLEPYVARPYELRETGFRAMQTLSDLAQYGFFVTKDGEWVDPEDVYVEPPK